MEFSAPQDEEKLIFHQRAAVKALYQRLNDDNALPGSWSKAPSGKPCFNESNWKLSISHSDHFVAMAVALNAAVGIDIQVEMDNKLKSYSNYLSWPEDNFFFRWCLYEAIFKADEKCSQGLINKVGEITIPSPSTPFPWQGLQVLCWSPSPGLSASLVAGGNLLHQDLCTKLKFRPA